MNSIRVRQAQILFLKLVYVVHMSLSAVYPSMVVSFNDYRCTQLSELDC